MDKNAMLSPKMVALTMLALTPCLGAWSCGPETVDLGHNKQNMAATSGSSSSSSTTSGAGGGGGNASGSSASSTGSGGGGGGVMDAFVSHPPPGSVLCAQGTFTAKQANDLCENPMQGIASAPSPPATHCDAFVTQGGVWEAWCLPNDTYVWTRTDGVVSTGKILDCHGVPDDVWPASGIIDVKDIDNPACVGGLCPETAGNSAITRTYLANGKIAPTFDLQGPLVIVSEDRLGGVFKNVEAEIAIYSVFGNSTCQSPGAGFITSSVPIVW